MRLDFIKKIKELIQFENHINPDQIDKNCMDEWGLVVAHSGSDDWGIEYNLCYDNGECESAFYQFYKVDDDEYEMNTSRGYYYEIDFDDPYWEEKLIMKAASIIFELSVTNF